MMLAFGTSSLLAQDAGKEITITGNMVCAKCTLHETTSLPERRSSDKRRQNRQLLSRPK